MFKNTSGRRLFTISGRDFTAPRAGAGELTFIFTQVEKVKGPFTGVYFHLYLHKTRSQGWLGASSGAAGQVEVEQESRSWVALGASSESWVGIVLLQGMLHDGPLDVPAGKPPPALD